MNDPDRAGEHRWFGYGPARLVQRFEQEAMLSEQDGHLAVEADDGTLAGTASWFTRTAEYLFRHTPAVRVEASTEASNTAERTALERAWFTHEGTLRQAVFRDGQWRDATIYGLLRREVELSSGW